jgi:hypothetical protein
MRRSRGLGDVYKRQGWYCGAGARREEPNISVGCDFGAFLLSSSLSL